MSDFSQESPFLSILIPVMNEEANIEPLALEVDKAMAGFPQSWECLWIDDGSTDGSHGRLQALATRSPRHRFISFQANAGQSAALHAGFRNARGEVLATLDADGQNDPADIPRLVEMLEGGKWDMVNGYRARRRDTVMRRIASRLGNGFRNLMTGKTVRDVGCSTRVFRKHCVEKLPCFKGMHRFLPTLVSMEGFRITEVAVNHRPRQSGSSKYTNWNRMWIGIADCLGVLWLRKRKFTARIRDI